MKKVRTLVVVPKNEGCNANCSFCITKNNSESNCLMTGKGDINLNRLEKSIKFAQSFGVIDTKIMGGTEPTLVKPERLLGIVKMLSDYFGQVTMYTNGKMICSEEDNPLIGRLAKSGLTNLIISRAHYDPQKNAELMGMEEYNFEKTVSETIKNDVDLKMSCVLSKKGIGNEQGLVRYLENAKKVGVDNVIFRELFYMDYKNSQGKWIRENYVSANIVEGLMEKQKAYSILGIWNQRVWDYHGIAVTIRPDSSRTDTKNNIDLVYMPDNHLYSSWNTRASRIM